MKMTNLYAGSLPALREIHSRGITGKGVAVAVLDTGIYPHPDFFVPEKRILCFKDFVGGKNALYDDNGHGTHVSGIIASGGRAPDGSRIGTAPEARLLALKVLEKDGGGKISNMLLGLDWILKNHLRYMIRIVNISVGMPVKNETDPEEDVLVKKVEQLWDAGLTVVVAAGNGGPQPSSVTSPGVSRKVITVGAMGSADYCVEAKYSGRGPVPGTSVCKPDIIAPASDIISCDNRGRAYKKRSGTSMATPFVSGVIALLLSKEPALSNKEVKRRLLETATDCGREKSRQGWGAVNPGLLLL